MIDPVVRQRIQQELEGTRGAMQRASQAERDFLLGKFAESNRAGKGAVIMLEDRTLPIVPVVLWPQLSHHRDQADLSRLLAELMCKAMRRRLGRTVEIQPALTDWDEMAKCGVQRWEEWQVAEFDWVCPHCGMVNWQPCCADNRRAKM